MKWNVSAAVHAGKYLGTFEAETGAEAIRKALRKNGDVSVCHQCSSDVSDPELGEITASSEDGQYSVTEGAPATWEEQARAAGWTPPASKKPAPRARKARAS